MEQTRHALRAAPDRNQARSVWQAVAAELGAPSSGHAPLVEDVNAAAALIRRHGGVGRADLRAFDRKLLRLAALKAQDEGFLAQDADACAVAATKQALALSNVPERVQLYEELTGTSNWRTFNERLGEAP